jgi:hypothetical protein
VSGEEAGVPRRLRASVVRESHPLHRFRGYLPGGDGIDTEIARGPYVKNGATTAADGRSSWRDAKSLAENVQSLLSYSGAAGRVAMRDATLPTLAFQSRAISLA